MSYLPKKLKGKELVIYKNKLSLTRRQREIIVGTLLGDASMRLRLGKPSLSIKFEQSIHNKEYIDHLYNVFEPLIGMVPATCTSKDNTISIWFCTYRHSCLKFYSDIFYPVKKNFKKSVPKIISRLLTPRAIAYWYMDYGSFDGSSYFLHTQGFDLKDQHLLLKALSKFNIKTKIHKDPCYLRIYILSESKVIFRDLIKPYILNCFYYKL